MLAVWHRRRPGGLLASQPLPASQLSGETGGEGSAKTREIDARSPPVLCGFARTPWAWPLTLGKKKCAVVGALSGCLSAPGQGE